MQCVYSLDPERNNLETLINITVEFYITQVASSSSVFYTGLFLQLFLDAPNRLNKLNIPQSMHCKTLLLVIIKCPSQLLFLFNNFAFLHKTRPKVYRCDICTTARLTTDSVCLMQSLYYILIDRQKLVKLID